ncbi:MAG: hypothetical protein WAM91_02550 [Candidatus Acidiferrales bacterium]
MARTPAFCVVILLVMALSIASAGAFACQIVCATAPAPTPMSNAGACGGHTHAPVHHDGGHQNTGHTHSRIIAATHSSSQQRTLQQVGLLPHGGGFVPAFAGANCALRFDMATAKSPSLIFTTPVLRV